MQIIPQSLLNKKGWVVIWFGKRGRKGDSLCMNHHREVEFSERHDTL